MQYLYSFSLCLNLSETHLKVISIGFSQIMGYFRSATTADALRCVLPSPRKNLKILSFLTLTAYGFSVCTTVYTVICYGEKQVRKEKFRFEIKF